MAKQSTEVTKVTSMEKITKDGITSLKKITGNIDELKKKGESLTISNIDDTEGYKLVDEHRKAVKVIRTSVEKKRKELKEPALKFGKEVDAVAKQLTELLTPIEEAMERKQKVIDDQKEQIKLALARKISDRTNQCYKAGMLFNGTDFRYKDIRLDPSQIGILSDEAWTAFTNELDKAISADKEEELIFAIPEPEPMETVQPACQEEVVQPRGNDFQHSDFRRDAPSPVQTAPIPVDFTPTVSVFKGLLVEVYKTERMEATLNGASSRHHSMLLIGPGIPEISTESDPDRVVRLEHINIGAEGAVTIEGQQVRIKRVHPFVVPMSIDPGKGSMFGGNFIHSCDSRFPSGQPIAIHDRVE